MKYHIELTPEAKRGVEQTFRWIANRSPDGAQRWYERFWQVVAIIVENPLGFGRADEGLGLGIDIRQTFFKTRRGRRYRIVFRVCEDQIQLLAVRGPGQPPLEDRDIHQ